MRFSYFISFLYDLALDKGLKPLAPQRAIDANFSGFDITPFVVIIVGKIAKISRKMLLEDYFNFFADDDIRLKGTRIGIETILFDYLFRAKTAEEIAETYTSLSLEQVYATLLYYWHNKSEVDAYLKDWLEWGDRMRAEQQQNPRPIVERLRNLKAQKLNSVQG